MQASRQPVHQRSVSTSVGRTQRRLLDEPRRQLLGQCRDRGFLLLAEKQSASRAKLIEHATRPRLMCSITSSGGIVLSGVTRRLATQPHCVRATGGVSVRLESTRPAASQGAGSCPERFGPLMPPIANVSPDRYRRSAVYKELAVAFMRSSLGRGTSHTAFKRATIRMDTLVGKAQLRACSASICRKP